MSISARVTARPLFVATTASARARVVFPTPPLRLTKATMIDIGTSRVSQAFSLGNPTPDVVKPPAYTPLSDTDSLGKLTLLLEAPNVLRRIRHNEAKLFFRYDARKISGHCRI